MKKFLCFVIVSSILFSLEAQVTRFHIGTTKYDLQTNNSIERRVVVDPITKKIAVTFTGSKDADGTYAERGTGYAFWDGSSWKNKSGITFTPPYDTFFPRVEDKRVGWPNPCFIGNSESIITHISDGGFNGLYRAYRATAGTGAWTYSQITTGKETWPRVAVSGNKMVIISSFFEADFNGVPGGLMFIKSSDGGVTWTQPDSIPGVNADNYAGVGGDNYHVDLKGDTIAILTGVNDVTLYKSTNFGTSWTKKSFVPTSDNFASLLNRADRSDGTYSVLIDNSGKVHCFWGRQVTFSDPAQGSGNFIDIQRTGIMYWNEGMEGKDPVVLPRTDFVREHIKAPMSPVGRFNTTSTSGSQINYMGTGSGYNVSTSTWPSTGIDAAGNLYLTYAYNRGKIDTSNTGVGKDAEKTGFNLYDVYAMKSMDGGMTWAGPMNISSTPVLESTFPSMARYVDDSLYVVWQEDSLYGNAVITVTGSANGTGSQSGPIHTNNKAMFAKAAVSAIVSPSTDITPPKLILKNSFVNILTNKGLNSRVVVKYKGCMTDTVTGKTISLSKKFLLDNMFEFSDDVDGVDTTKLFTDSLYQVKLDVPGTYIVQFWGKDAAGNSTQAGGSYLDTLVMAFIVLDDTEGPTITLNGTDPTYVYLNGTFTDLGVVVSDNNPCTAASFTKSGTVNTATAGTYTITYNSIDGANNTSTATRKVVVGIEPTAKITEESLVNKVLKGKGTTSLNVSADANTSFKWLVKKANTALTSSLAPTGLTNTLNYTLPASFPEFDSLCLEVKNDFNAVFSKPTSRDCKFLKYTVGIQSLNKDVSIEVFPNPNNGSFNIKVNGNKSNKARVTLTNMEGKTITDDVLQINNSVIPFNTNLGKGIYFMTTEVDGNVYLDRLEVK